MAKNRLRAIPLGGAGEVGRNMWVLEQNDEILVLDCGVMFPEADMLGVDLVLPTSPISATRRTKSRRLC